MNLNINTSFQIKNNELHQSGKESEKEKSKLKQEIETLNNLHSTLIDQKVSISSQVHLNESFPTED